MRECVLKQIDNIIEIIYSMDKVGLDKAFIELIDNLVKLIEDENWTNTGSLNEVLMNLQEAYIKRDLTDLADVLLYQLKIFFDESSTIS